MWQRHRAYVCVLLASVWHPELCDKMLVELLVCMLLAKLSDMSLRHLAAHRPCMLSLIWVEIALLHCFAARTSPCRCCFSVTALESVLCWLSMSRDASLQTLGFHISGPWGSTPLRASFSDIELIGSLAEYSDALTSWTSGHGLVHKPESTQIACRDAVSAFFYDETRMLAEAPI